MYRFRVIESVKNDIEAFLDRSLFYLDSDGEYYIDQENLKTYTYKVSLPDGDHIFSTITMNQICQELYETNFDDQSEMVLKEENSPRDVNIVSEIAKQPFAAKELNGKKLFKRVHGVTAVLNGETKIELVVPYNECKINTIQILWAPEGLTGDFKVYDTPTGTISGASPATGYTAIPNLMLNQFGHNVGIGKDYFEETSNYDADLIKDMKLELTLYNPNLETKTICVNFILHELK